MTRSLAVVLVAAIGGCGPVNTPPIAFLPTGPGVARALAPYHGDDGVRVVFSTESLGPYTELGYVEVYRLARETTPEALLLEMEHEARTHGCNALVVHGACTAIEWARGGRRLDYVRMGATCLYVEPTTEPHVLSEVP